VGTAVKNCDTAAQNQRSLLIFFTLSHKMGVANNSGEGHTQDFFFLFWALLNRNTKILPPFE